MIDIFNNDEEIDESQLAPLPEGPLCGLCYCETKELFDAPCHEKPELPENAKLGMYHCPDCGMMLFGGLPHFQICKTCLDELANKNP